MSNWVYGIRDPVSRPPLAQAKAHMLQGCLTWCVMEIVHGDFAANRPCRALAEDWPQLADLPSDRACLACLSDEQ